MADKPTDLQAEFDAQPDLQAAFDETPGQPAPAEDLHSLFDSMPDHPEPNGLHLQQPGNVVHEAAAELGDGDLGKAFQLGLKEYAAPMSLTKEELQRPNKTWAEAATRMGTTIAADIVTSVGTGVLGGAIGGPVGAAVGGLSALGIAAYRNFGYEAAVADAEGRKFNPINGVLGMATDLNPIVGRGSKLLKGGIQFGLEATKNYQYSHDMKTALVAGALGGATVGALHNDKNVLVSVLQPALRPNSLTKASTTPASFVKEMEKAVSDDSKYQIARKAAERADELEAQGWFDMPEDGNLPAEFKKWYLDQYGRRSDGALDSDFNFYSSKEGSQQLEVDWKNWKKQQIDLDVINQTRYEIGGGDKAFPDWFIRTHGEKGEDDINVIAKRIEEKELSASYTNPADETTKVSKNKAPPRLAPEIIQDAKNEFGKANADLGADPLNGKVYRTLTDMKYVTRRIDDVAGTNFEGAVDSLSLAKNAHAGLTFPYTARASELIQEGRRAGMTNQQVGKALNYGSYRYKSAEQAALVGKWRTLFDDTRDHLRKLGMDIGHLDNYLPQSMLRDTDLHSALKQQYDWLNVRAKTHGLDEPWGLLRKTDGSNATLVKDKEQMIQFLDTLERLRGKRPETTKEITESIRIAEDPSVAEKRLGGYEASVLFKRTGQMPDFARDFDVGRVFGNYLNTNFKAYTHNDALRQVAAQMKIADEMGYKDSVAYFSKYIHHLSGGETGAVSLLQSVSHSYRSYFEKLRLGEISKMLVKDDELGQSVAWHGFSAMEDQIRQKATAKLKAINTMKLLPDVFSTMVASAYPNLLGLNAKAIIRNLEQPTLLTGMDIGAGYGNALVLKASIKAAKRLMSGESPEAFLKSMGHSSGKYVGESMQLGSDTIRQIKGIGMAVEAAEKLGEISMKMYGISDTFNRYVTWHTADLLAKDAINGNASALKAMSKMSVAYKNQAAEAIRKRDREGLTAALAGHLISKTQFYYGKEQQSELGRHAGRFFTMFTKWPVMMGSEVAYYTRKGEYSTWMKKLAAPLAVLAAADAYLGDTKDDPKFRYIMGKNLKSSAPLWSLFGIANMTKPPVVEAGVEAIDAFQKAADGDFSAAKKAAGNAASIYTPGLGAVWNEYLRQKRAQGE